MFSIIRHTLWTILVLTIPYTGWSQEIQIEFHKDGKKIELKNDFDVYFIMSDSLQKIIIKPIIKNNRFKIPDFIKSKKGNIAFKYGNIVFDLGFGGFQYEQNFIWLIGYDKKPFEKEYHFSQVHDKKIKAIVYLEYIPLEHGDGIERVVCIDDIKQYFKESKILIE